MTLDDGSQPHPVRNNTYAVFRATKIPPDHPARGALSPLSILNPLRFRASMWRKSRRPAKLLGLREEIGRSESPISEEVQAPAGRRLEAPERNLHAREVRHRISPVLTDGAEAA